MRSPFLSAIVFLLFPFFANAQSTLSGTVLTTRGDTVIGANILLEGTYDGATTDINGFFSFRSAEQGAQTLLVIYLGCDTFRQIVQLPNAKLQLAPRLKESASALQEVVISAGSFEAASDRKKAVILSSIDIALTASATADIAGAITTLPGTTRNGESGQILVRGGAGYETRTFIDGLLVQNPYNSSVPNVPARNRFSPFLFKGTMFSTGGYSAEYGQALSSALILQTEDLAPKNNTGVSLMSVGGGLSHTQRWKRTSASLSGSYSNLAPYFALLPQNIDWIKAPQSGGAELILRHQTKQEGMVKLYGSANRSAMSMNYPDAFQPEQTNPLSLLADNVYLNTSYRSQVGKWTMFAGLAYTWNRDSIGSNIAQRKIQQSAQARFTLSRSYSRKVKLKFGGEYLTGRYDEYFRDTDFSQFHVLRKEQYGAAFAESDLVISSKIVARVGLRAEHSGLLQKTNLAPRISAAYILDDNEQVAMAFGQFYQNPEYDLLRRNTDLQFERATHYMLNYQRIRNGYTFRVEAYQKTYKNLVKTDPSTYLSNNGGGGYARGIDVFFRDQKTIKRGDYWVSYSYLDTKRDYRDFPVEAVPTFAATHNVSVVYKHWFSGINTAFGATYAYQSGRPYNDPNTNAFNSGRTPDYHDLSVNASYLTNLAGHFTILYVSATNILGFDQVYGYQFGTAPGPDGRFAARAITPPSRHFLFVGLFINFGQRYKASETTKVDI
ncbi:MAG: TonB-dependent receptor [Saprospiraceae bacterium]|nr:TonB-dependent receptor [Saprospiraceae bacterium]